MFETSAAFSSAQHDQFPPASASVLDPNGKIQMSNPCTGLDPEELDRLFDRFYRPDRSRSKQTGGVGVGLSIARSIADAHRGSIWAECPGKGLVQFVVVLRE